MTGKQELWIMYLLGVFVMLAWKLTRYCWQGKKTLNKPIVVSLEEWFFEKTAANEASWSATLLNMVAAVTVGRIYISQLKMWEFIGTLPLDNVVAFALGVGVEIAAPNFAKWFVAKLTAPPGS